MTLHLILKFTCYDMYSCAYINAYWECAFVSCIQHDNYNSVSQIEYDSFTRYSFWIRVTALYMSACARDLVYALLSFYYVDRYFCCCCWCWKSINHSHFALSCLEWKVKFVSIKSKSLFVSFFLSYIHFVLLFLFNVHDEFSFKYCYGWVCFCVCCFGH